VNASLLPYLVFGLLAAGSFTFATILQPLADAWTRRNDSSGILKVLLGDGRRLFANHFFVKADVTFHGGYYPSIFDQAASVPKDKRHLKMKDPEEHDHAHQEGEDAHPEEQDQDHAHADANGTNSSNSSNSTNSMNSLNSTNSSNSTNSTESIISEREKAAHDEHEKAMAFMGPPRDWIEAFGRNFIIQEHTHLQGGKEREMLPWLRISAELNPNNPDTYTVAAYWLRDLGRTKEAEAFLREGVRNNPDSYEIYFELGNLYFTDYKNVGQARNFWDLALKKWSTTQEKAKEPDFLALDQIAVHLAHLEEGEKNYDRAIALLKLASKATPHPEALESRIKELEGKKKTD